MKNSDGSWPHLRKNQPILNKDNLASHANGHVESAIREYHIPGNVMGLPGVNFLFNLNTNKKLLPYGCLNYKDLH